MKLTARAFLITLIYIIAASAVWARKPGVQPGTTVAGVYESFAVGKGSGDLEGMRVVIVPAGGGYYAIVQIAQGGAEDPKPEFVAAKVIGMNVEFAAGSEKFRGTIRTAALTLKNSAGESLTLKRKSCGAYFK